MMIMMMMMYQTNKCHTSVTLIRFITYGDDDHNAMMMTKYRTQTSHKCVTLIRFIQDDDDENYDVDEDIENEYVSQVCDTCSFYKR